MKGFVTNVKSICKRPGLFRSLVIVSLLLCAGASSALAADDTAAEIKELRQMVQQLAGEVRSLKAAQAEKTSAPAEYQQQLEALRADVAKLNESPINDIADTLGKLSVGGYGEIHSNFAQGSDSDKIDMHRLVMYLGYDFADWIKLNTEIEIEHAFVQDDDGEVSVEQAYVDFLLSDYFNVRAGRLLTPLGIINQTHEPTTFNGVERPNFSKYIIPTTWYSDGAGIFGNLNSELSYEAYVTGGLDGSGFSSSGIRGGRIKSTQSLNDPAFSARMDYTPFAEALLKKDQSLRFGVSGYFGGLNNAAGGGGSSNTSDISMAAADFEYSISRFDFRGVMAHTSIDGARSLGDGQVAKEMFGWYLEGAYHFWPDEWKVGKLAKSDATVFVRYEDYDTQYKMPSGVDADAGKNKQDITFGINFYPTPNFVIKADYQVFDDASSGGRDDQFNVGIGWAF